MYNTNQLFSDVGINYKGHFSNSHLILLFLGIYIFYGMFFYFNNSYFIDIIKAYYRKIYNKKINQKKSIIVNKLNTILLIPYFLTSALFIIIFLNKLNLVDYSVKNFTITLAFLIIVFILKAILYLYVSFVDNNNIFIQIINNKIIMLIHNALFLSFMSFLICYISKEMQMPILIITLLLLLIFEIINHIRNIFLIMNFKLYFFKNILYFCTIEILPLLYFIRLYIKEVIY